MMTGGRCGAPHRQYRVRLLACTQFVAHLVCVAAGLIYRYYWHKLQQLSRLAQQEEGAEEEEGGGDAMDGDGAATTDEPAEFGGRRAGLVLEPGWAGQLQDIAAYLRMLDLEVRCAASRKPC